MSAQGIYQGLSRLSNLRVTRYAVALVLVAGATGLRAWPLGALELRIPWVTFYPAVMAAALFGGFVTGALATALSAFVVIFWSPPGLLPFIDDPADWLGLAVFSVNGLLISGMSEAMHRARARARAPDTTPESRRNQEIITTSGEHLLNLINNVLDISKIEAGHIIREDAPTDLPRLLQELERTASSRKPWETRWPTLRPAE